MAAPSKQIRDFMEKYGVDSDEIWLLPGGKSYAIKHVAIERIASQQGIETDFEVKASDQDQKTALFIGYAKLGDRKVKTTGEAAPYNNKNSYPNAIAEKRAIDRAVLKLLNTHGQIYSEDEADDFARRENPHVTRPDDLVPTVEYDEHGQPVDNIPLGDDRITQLPKTKAKNEYAAMQSEMLATKTPQALEQWGAANKNRVATLPQDWQEILRGQYTDHMNDLRRAAA